MTCSGVSGVPRPQSSPAATTCCAARDVPRVGQEDVEEARAGDLDVVDRLPQPLAQLRPEPLGDLARRRAQRGREQHRGVRRVVAETCLLRALQARARVRRRRCRCAGRPRPPRPPPAARRWVHRTANDGMARWPGSCAHGRAAPEHDAGEHVRERRGSERQLWSAPPSSIPNAPPITKHTSRPACRRSSSQPANASEVYAAPAAVEQADPGALGDPAQRAPRRRRPRSRPRGRSAKQLRVVLEIVEVRRLALPTATTQ